MIINAPIILPPPVVINAPLTFGFIQGIPPGGTVGQVLTKTGPEDFAVAWADATGGGGGGTTLTVSGGYGRFTLGATGYEFPVFES